MRLEDALPALRAGRRARRGAWPAGQFIVIDLVGGARLDHFTKKGDVSESIWPGSQLESRDMLCHDWELLALPEYEAYVPRNFREAVDIVLSMLSKETFDPYEEARKSRSYGQSGVQGTRADCDWKEMGKECLDRYIEAASAKDVDARQHALARACISSLKALSYQVAERYISEVMDR